MTDQEFATYLSAWEVARNARDQDPTSATIARANSAREAYLAALDIQRSDARELTVDWAPGVLQEARAHFGKLPDFATFYRLSAPAPEPRDGTFGALLKRLGLLDWSGPGPRVRMQIGEFMVAPNVVRPLYRVDWGDDIQADVDATNARKRGDQVDDEAQGEA